MPRQRKHPISSFFIHSHKSLVEFLFLPVAASWAATTRPHHQFFYHWGGQPRCYPQWTHQHFISHRHLDPLTHFTHLQCSFQDLFFFLMAPALIAPNYCNFPFNIWKHTTAVSYWVHLIKMICGLCYTALYCFLLILSLLVVSCRDKVERACI